MEYRRYEYRAEIFDCSVVSYNYHGLNQGLPLIHSLCDPDEFNIDIILLQDN